MLGWTVSAYLTGVEVKFPPTRQPAASASPVARWTSGISGLGWMEDLCKSGAGIFLGGDGYPFRCAFRASSLKPILLETPTRLHRTEFIESTAPLPPGEGMRCPSEILSGPDDHWLLLEAFDRS